MAKLQQYRLSKSIPWFQIGLGGYQDAQVAGLVVSHQLWWYTAKKKKDQPKVELVPLENFRFDPSSQWYAPVGTSPYLLQMIPMYVKDVRSRMKSGRWMKYDDTQILTAMRNFDTTRMVREENRADSTQNVTTITDYSICLLYTSRCV